MIPTPEAIRALDGEALTALSYRLGLGPHGQPVVWLPHYDLTQGSMVLQALREEGWDTHVQYFARTDTGQVGVWQRDAKNKLRGELVQWQGAEREAEAILRCCCLAMAEWHLVQREEVP